jgi:hypothetical protein
LVDVGALGDGDDGEAAIGEMEGGTGIGKNPGAEDYLRIKIEQGLLEGGAEGIRHEEVIRGAADFWKVRGGDPLGLERGILRACGELFVSPGEHGTRRKDADFEMSTEGVEERRVIQAPVGLGGGGEEV